MSTKTLSFFSHDTQQAVSEITEILRAPVYARLLVLAFESGLFSLLNKTSINMEELIAELGWQSGLADTVLNAMVYSGYIVKDSQGLLTCSPKIEILLQEHEFIQGVIRDWSLAHEDLGLLPEILESGSLEKCQLYRRWGYKIENRGTPGAKEVSAYSKDMDSSSRIHSTLFLNTIDLSKYSKLLDVGGGYGEFAMQACERYPQLKTAVFDLPKVRNSFEIKVKKRELEDRVTFFEGNFLNDQLPEFAQAITLNRVLWDWQDREARKILHSVNRALSPMGQILIYEAMYTGDPKLDRLRAATAIQHMFFGAKTRSVEEITHLLQQTGFNKIQVLDSALAAYKVVVGSRV